jgi:hypothetical protein
VKKLDLMGKRFGRLVVVEPRERGRWATRCDCGVTKVISGPDMHRGKITSCGCYRRELNKQMGRLTGPTNFRRSQAKAALARTQHGQAQKGRLTRLYKAWLAMNNRCSNPKHQQYIDYGGRGITVCDRWRGKGGFEHFAADVGEAPSKKHSLDRKDNDRGYEPDNCRWATRSEQNSNKRSRARVRADREAIRAA